MQLLNLRDRAYTRKTGEHCPPSVVRRKRAVGVGGGEAKRLGGSYGVSFLNEGSDQCKPLRGRCIFVVITKCKVRKISVITLRE